jgi:hypothetical protein
MVAGPQRDIGLRDPAKYACILQEEGTVSSSSYTAISQLIHENSPQDNERYVKHAPENPKKVPLLTTLTTML